MSDTSQGPGWWKASDGKWYAPELHPDARAQRAAAPAPQAEAVPTTPAVSSVEPSVAREAPDELVAEPTVPETPAPGRRGFGGRELVLVALAAFLLGGLAGFAASRYLTDDATASSDENNSPNVATVERDVGNTDRPEAVDDTPADPAQEADREAKANLRKAFSAAKTLATDWEGRWSTDAANTPIDFTALAREAPEVTLAAAGEAAPGVVSVRVETVDAPNSDLWLAGGSESGAFFCIHATSAGSVFYGTGTSEDDALAKCVAESWS